MDYGITHIICIRQDIESHLIKTHFADKFRYCEYLFLSKLLNATFT